jgi:hypothetical protein
MINGKSIESGQEHVYLEHTQQAIVNVKQK